MYNICVFWHSKIMMFKLNIIGYFLLSLICPCMICLKEKKICKENQSKKNKNALNMVASVFLGDIRVIGCTSKVIVSIKQLWLCVSYIDFLISKIVITWNTYVLLWYFHTQHTKFFVTFDTCAGTMWFVNHKKYIC